VSERKESRSKLYLIPVRQIVANTNPRNPLSAELQKKGYGVFAGEPGLPPLWKLGTSDSQQERALYADLIREHDPDLAALASNVLALGLLEAVEVHDNGNKSGANTYTLVFGCRRCLAVLYNWCVLGKPSEPVVEARLVKGNEVTLMHRAVSENVRKQPSAVEEARAYQFALNAMETKEDLARTHGVSVATINNRLALLELPVAVQKRIEEGTLKPTKALEAFRAEEKSEETEKKPRMRSRKAVEEALTEFADTTPQGRVLAWVLGTREEF
jgi:ParB/RepB/Spo0J family partition protein